MRREDLKTVLILGSGPIIIGQACEFDYSGTQACKALREDGIRVVLINSNPATIMTDPDVSDATYVEPITAAVCERVIARERPDALLPTLGGQTGLNVAVELAKSGVLERYGVEMIGATLEVIERAEDRDVFKKIMLELGVEVSRSGIARTLDQARDLLPEVGLPAIVRASFTLGGRGSGIAYNRDEYDALCSAGLEASPIDEILIEESMLGWKEYELELMRDRADNAVIVCSIENLDPMGVHTGDSITVAPALTLSDHEYQRMRDAALRIMCAIGVETGGANIQFAVEPSTGRQIVIEMNPRVSRSSALASKATGFPIAKIAAKLAIGYTLDELPNDITKKTPASFEPSLDYVVVKIPRFTFEKFAGVDDVLTTSMKSVGEVMAIGRCFKEALQKALRSLERDWVGLGFERNDPVLAGLRDGGADADVAAHLPTLSAIRRKLTVPNSQRIFYLRYALRVGIDVDELYNLTGIDRWFLREIRELVCDGEQVLCAAADLEAIGEDQLRELKRAGYGDAQMARVLKCTEWEVRERRRELGVGAVFKPVDTCAAEFEAFTPYYYSTYETEDERQQGGERPRVVIIGSGPNRIGQGIEFDYCCVHAALALREDGYETVMVNSNPETVSTDYDTSDRLYFEPLTLENVLNVCEAERPLGVVVQLGGQTPLKLAAGLERAGFRILGTSTDSIDLAEDRQRFSVLAKRLDLLLPKHGLAVEFEGARDIAQSIGYPVLVRPSYVLGGRAMEIVYDDVALKQFLAIAVSVAPDRPVLIDQFIEDAIEVDVDAVCDRAGEVYVGGIMEHIEEAGTHSGDSSCTLPPYTLSDSQIARVKAQTVALARALRVVGLMNIQFAIKGDQIYCLEVNPRASRTVPFVSKAIGVSMAKVAARVILGNTLTELGIVTKEPEYISVKKSVFPWSRLPGSDALGGPEMRSTGEVMGIGRSFGTAVAKAQLAAGTPLPTEGTVFVSVKDSDKRGIVLVAKQLADMGFKIIATRGTHRVLRRHGVHALAEIHKVGAGRPNILDALRNGDVVLIINTPSGKDPRADEARIRSLAVTLDIPCLTTLPAAAAAVSGIQAMQQVGEDWLEVRSLQAMHAEAQSVLSA